MSFDYERAKLMKAREWAQREFTENSAPTNNTVRKWVVEGKISGEIIGCTVYVYEDQRFGMSPHVSQAVSQLISATR